MMNLSTEQRERLRDPQYPLAAKYDPEWIIANHMGSQCLWLTESLTRVMELRPGMRILDLGCGKALSSIFLAREFKVQVWAADLWIEPGDNWKRIEEAKVEDFVYPIRSEAHALPFAEGFFDAVVSINAHHLYGTDETYLTRYFLKFVKPKGQIGLIVPGLIQEFDPEIPAHIQKYWVDDFLAYHTPRWWQHHFEKTGRVEISTADHLDDGHGWKLWEKWQEIIGNVGLLRDDSGRYISFVRLVARKKES